MHEMMEVSLWSKMENHFLWMFSWFMGAIKAKWLHYKDYGNKFRYHAGKISQVFISILCSCAWLLRGTSMWRGKHFMNFRMKKRIWTCECAVDIRRIVSWLSHTWKVKSCASIILLRRRKRAICGFTLW